MKNGAGSSVMTQLMFMLKKNCENRCFTISELSGNFLQISQTLLYEVVTQKLRYNKIRNWYQHGHSLTAQAEFLQHIITGDETWVSYAVV